MPGAIWSLLIVPWQSTRFCQNYLKIHRHEGVVCLRLQWKSLPEELDSMWSRICNIHQDMSEMVNSYRKSYSKKPTLDVTVHRLNILKSVNLHQISWRRCGQLATEHCKLHMSWCGIKRLVLGNRYMYYHASPKFSTSHLTYSVVMMFKMPTSKWLKIKNFH